MYATAGNHEYHRNVSALIEYTNLDPTGRWYYPDFYYSVSYLNGRVLMLMLDTAALGRHKPWDYATGNRTDEDKLDREGPQYDWIRGTLVSNSQAEVVVVSTHYPVYSAGDHGSQKDFYSAFKNLFHSLRARFLLENF